jgi:hypothetical protein
MHFFRVMNQKNTHAKFISGGARKGQHARAQGGVQVITFSCAGTSAKGHVGDSWADELWFTPRLLKVLWPKVKKAAH